MTQPDEMMTRIGEGITLSQQGDRRNARQVFDRLWNEVGADGNPLHRCALAHSMADVQDDPAEELVWDLQALDAADAVTETQAAASGMQGPAGMYPSLHLNLGDVYLRLGDRQAARQHLDAGLAAAGSLGDDGYGMMIRRGLDALRKRLNAPG